MMGLGMPRELRPAADTAAALLTNPAAAPVPAWLVPLFADVGARHELAPELLAAIAATFSGFNPAAPGGLMGFPSPDATVEVARLVEKDARALAQLRSHVEQSAEWLAAQSRGDDGLSGALVRYVERFAADVPEWRAYTLAGCIDPAAVVAEIVGRFAQLVGRVLARSPLGKLLAGL